MLTKKYVYGSLALAVMLACSSAQAKVYVKDSDSWVEGENFVTSSDIAAVFSDKDGETVDADSSDIKSDKEYGVLAYNNATLNVFGTDINISSSTTSGDANAVGAVTQKDDNNPTKFTDGGKVNIGNDIYKKH